MYEHQTNEGKGQYKFAANLPLTDKDKLYFGILHKICGDLEKDALEGKNHAYEKTAFKLY